MLAFLLVAGSILPAETPADSGKTTSMNRDGSLSFALGLGGMAAYGEVGDVFTDVSCISIEIGARYHRATINLSVQRHDPYELNPDFVSQTGYLDESIWIGSRLLGVETGFIVFRSRYVQIEPRIGLCQTIIFEDYPFRYDPHPNWDLSARSSWEPTVALRFYFTFWARDWHESVHWFFVEARYTRLAFDNSEFGDGYLRGMIGGYCFDWVIF